VVVSGGGKGRWGGPRPSIIWGEAAAFAPKGKRKASEKRGKTLGGGKKRTKGGRLLLPPSGDRGASNRGKRNPYHSKNRWRTYISVGGKEALLDFLQWGGPTGKLR